MTVAVMTVGILCCGIFLIPKDYFLYVCVCVCVGAEVV